MYMKKISVIIPVYNVRDYLPGCLESVKKQSLADIEVILVDDGSTDVSGKICDAFADENENTAVFHKENGGLSDARNFGLDKACGEYIIFLDSDDEIDSDACKRLYEEAKKSDADMVIGEALLKAPSASMERFENVVRENFDYGRIYSGREYLIGCLSHGALRVEAWRSLYKREFLEKNGLKFRKGVAHEDEEFTPRALYEAEKIKLLPYKWYRYNNKRAGSIMHSGIANKKKADDRVAIYNSLSVFYGNAEPEKLKKLLLDDLSWKYIECFKSGAEVPRLLPLKLAAKPKRKIKALFFALFPRHFKRS